MRGFLEDMLPGETCGEAGTGEEMKQRPSEGLQSMSDASELPAPETGGWLSTLPVCTLQALIKGHAPCGWAPVFRLSVHMDNVGPLD